MYLSETHIFKQSNELDDICKIYKWNRGSCCSAKKNKIF